MAVADQVSARPIKGIDATFDDLQLDVHFVRAVRIGETVKLECRIIRKTRNLIFLDGTISAGDDVIATARLPRARSDRSNRSSRPKRVSAETSWAVSRHTHISDNITSEGRTLIIER
jgi:hypothetical protein